jgi:Skp family chaperone for outer membrane proteins
MPMATLAAAALMCHSAAAQQPAAAPTGAHSIHAARYGFAVVDVMYIFKKHNRFNAQIEQMKAEVQSTENGLRTERSQIDKRGEELKAFNPGTPEYNRLEEEIEKLKYEFNIKATKERKEFLDREAKIYYKTYLEVNDAVKVYAQRNNLGLVLRFNGDPVDPNRREDVLRAINKPIVYENGIDITPDVLNELNSRGGAAVAKPGGGVKPVVPGGGQRPIGRNPTAPQRN